MPFGTWNEIGLVVMLAFIVVLATKIGSIGAAVAGYLAKKRD